MRISDWSSDVCSSDLGPLGGERVEPVEGLAGFRGAEAGLEQAALEGVAVADEVRVFGEVVFEQIEQDVQDALLHFPRPAPGGAVLTVSWRFRSEEHTSELQSLMRISYAVFCLKKKKQSKYKRS